MKNNEIKPDNATKTRRDFFKLSSSAGILALIVGFKPFKMIAAAGQKTRMKPTIAVHPFAVKRKNEGIK